MKTSLKNAPDKGDEDVKPVADDQALAELGETAVSDSSSVSLALGSVEGSIGSRDLIIPKIHIVQNVGPLSQDFAGGDVVFNKETKLAKMGDPILLTVLSIKKTYEENLPYDPNGPRPVVYNTIKEVVDAGLWIDWRNNERPPVREVATALTLIEQPEGVDCLGFNQSIDGKDHALAMWTMRGTAYNKGARKIFSANQLELAQDGLLSGKWELTTERTLSGGNYVFAPLLRLVGKNSKEFTDEIAKRLS